MVYDTVASLMMNGFLNAQKVDVAPDGRTVIERPDSSGGEPLRLTVGYPDEPWQEPNETYTIATAMPGPARG